MKALANICEFTLPGHIYHNDNFSDDSIYHTIRDFSISYNDTFIYSLWQTSYNYFQLTFHPIFTDDGICFSFNDLNSHEIYTDVYDI